MMMQHPRNPECHCPQCTLGIPWPSKSDSRDIFYFGDLMSVERKRSQTDPERAHGYADEILVELVQWLSHRDGHHTAVDRILEDYGAVKKWYS
jgi:hypothetical protein